MITSLSSDRLRIAAIAAAICLDGSVSFLGADARPRIIMAWRIGMTCKFKEFASATLDSSKRLPCRDFAGYGYGGPGGSNALHLFYLWQRALTHRRPNRCRWDPEGLARPVAEIGIHRRAGCSVESAGLIYYLGPCRAFYQALSRKLNFGRS